MIVAIPRKNRTNRLLVPLGYDHNHCSLSLGESDTRATAYLIPAEPSSSLFLAHTFLVLVVLLGPNSTLSLAVIQYSPTVANHLGHIPASRKVTQVAQAERAGIEASGISLVGETWHILVKQQNVEVAVSW